MKKKIHKSRIFLTMTLGVMLTVSLIAGCKSVEVKPTGKEEIVEEEISQEEVGESEKDWIEIRVLDERTGKPIPQIGYTIKFDDGSERTGTTNDEGFLFEDDVPSDKYELILDGFDVIRDGDIYPFRRSNLK